MRQIWAPWRKVYIGGGHKKTSGCFLCRGRRSSRNKDVKNLLLHRSSHSFIILNRYPYTNGHLMVVPNRHVPSLEKLNNAERLDLLKLLDRSLAVLKKSVHPHGFNIGMNLGQTGGAGIPGHMHIHVVPRWKGDTNFMPVISGTKVISDSLSAVYKALSCLIKNKKRG
ncbi:MAG: HIT domain-containing protein [Candidatus Omnitrophica bacterium]|nr:HIT domain-containing protein [Candidatus Omnitrophota bacterium]